MRAGDRDRNRQRRDVEIEIKGDKDRERDIHTGRCWENTGKGNFSTQSPVIREPDTRFPFPPSAPRQASPPPSPSSHTWRTAALLLFGARRPSARGDNAIVLSPDIVSLIVYWMFFALSDLGQVTEQRVGGGGDWLTSRRAVIGADSRGIQGQCRSLAGSTWHPGTYQLIGWPHVAPMLSCIL